MSVRFDVEVSLALGADLTANPATWAWTDITAYCLVRDGGVTIRRGRGDWQSTAQPSSCEVLVNNTDGRFSRLNPLGAYYGQLAKNTPIRVRACETGGSLVTRFVGFVSEWPAEWDPSESHFSVSVHADGGIRRLGRGSASKSALFRTITGAAAIVPVAYWPLEDGSNATQAASGLTGGTAGTVLSTVRFGSADALPGASAAMAAETPAAPSGAQPTSGNLSLTVPTHLVGDESVRFWTQGTPWASPPTGGVQVTVGHQIRFVRTGGIGYANFMVTSYDAANFAGSVIGYWIQFFAVDGTFINELYTGTNHPTWDPFDGHWHETVLTLSQSGADIAATVYVDGVSGATATLATTTLTPISDVLPGVLGYYQDNVNAYVSPFSAPYSLAHLAVYSSAPGSFFDAATAAGYAGEFAHVRVPRVCAEEGVVVNVTATVSQAMGAQSTGDLLAVLRECESADFGLLLERKTGELGWDSHTNRENLSVAVALDYAQKQIHPPFKPTDDDQATRNDVTVTRTGGSSGRVVDTASVAAVGRYDEKFPLDLFADSQTIHAAGMRVNLGTVNEYRYPAVNLKLHRSSSLVSSWKSADIGSRFTIAHLPTGITYDLADEVLEGYAERINRYEWDITANLSPYKPYKTFVLAQATADAGEFTGRLAEDSAAAIRAAITTTATSVTIDPNRFRWTQVADDFNPNPTVRFGGETATISSVSTTALTFVAVGAASSADSAAVSPAIYAGAQADDWIVVVAGLRSTPGTTGAPTTPTGYWRLGVFDDPAVSADGAINVQVYVKKHSGSESAPSVGVQDAVAGDTLTAFTFGLRNMSLTVTDFDDLLAGFTVQTNGSATNIDYPSLQPTLDGCFVLLVGWRQDDYTSIAPPSGFTEMIEASTVVGNDQGLYAAYQIQTTKTFVPAGSVVVTTAGGAAASRAAVLALAGGYQTLTVSARSTNGVVKAHAAGTLIDFDNSLVMGL